MKSTTFNGCQAGAHSNGRPACTGKGNLPTAPAAPTLTLAGTQSAADNPSEAALGQATREQAKLPAPSLEIEPVCTRPDAAMNPVKSDIPTANTPVRTVTLATTR